jgi:hypothetical protein
LKAEKEFALIVSILAIAFILFLAIIWSCFLKRGAAKEDMVKKNLGID